MRHPFIAAMALGWLPLAAHADCPFLDSGGNRNMLLLTALF